jgi:hypothetical protein
MARDIYAYRDVAVESFQDGAQVRVRPVSGQAYHSGLRVQCSRELTDTGKHPLGTCFLVQAKLTDRQGGTPYLYVYHGDPVVVMSPEERERFLGAYRRVRI